MRRAAKVDGNHKPIVQAFRALGCSVRDTSGAGNGLADLVVGKHGVTHLVEVKMPGKKRTAAQVKWADGWRGSPVHLVTSLDDVRSLVAAWDSVAWKPTPHADSPTLSEHHPEPSMSRTFEQGFDADDYNGRPTRVVVHGGLIQRREVRVTPNVIRARGGA